MPLTSLVMVEVNMEMSWTCALKYGMDLCISQDLKLRERRVSLTEERKKERKKEKTQFLTPHGLACRQ